METPMTNPIEMGKSIADLGFVIMAAAGYLVYSAIIIFFFVKWFIRMVDGINEHYRMAINEMLLLVKEMHVMIKAMDKPKKD